MSVSETSATTRSTATPGGGSSALSRAAELGDDALAALAGGDPAPRAFLATLIERELFADAVKFVAHALQKREAVWWAWVCARKAAGADVEPKIKAALDATERWIVQPTDDNRRQAMTLGEAAEFSTAAGCAALAAFMSGGSIAPPNVQAVAPGEFLTAQAVSGSVTIAAVSGDPAQAKERFQEYLRLGLEVADRTKLWPS